MLAHHIPSYLFDHERDSDRRSSRGRTVRNPPQGGGLDPPWATWFDGLGLTHESDGTTITSGLVADQAALDGLLQNVRDIGLPLVSVTQVDPH